MSIREKLLVGLDEDVDFQENEIVYTLEKNGAEINVPLKDLKPKNAFINSPNDDWGKNEDYSSDNDEIEIETSKGDGEEDNENEDEKRNSADDNIFDEDEEQKPDFLKATIRRRRFKNEELNIREKTKEFLEKRKPKRKLAIFFESIFIQFGILSRKLNLNPFKWALSIIKKSFGTGIASFFELWMSIIYMNFAVFITMLLFLIIPWFLRTDIASNIKFSPFLTIDFYLGLLGLEDEQIGNTFFFYGGYANNLIVNSTFNGTHWQNSTSYETEVFSTLLANFIPYEFRFFYPLSIIIFFVVCIFILVYSIGKRFRNSNLIDSNMKYSNTLLSQFDHSLIGRTAISNLKNQITSQLLEYRHTDLEKIVEKQILKNKNILFLIIIRRLIGWSISFILVTISPAVVLVTTSYYDELNSIFPYTTSIIFWIISIIFPQI